MGKLYPLLAAFLLPLTIHAQIIWDFSSATPLSGVPAGVTVSAVSQGNNNGTTTLLTTTSASSGYTGASGGNNAGAAANIGAFRPDTTTYFEWTLTPAAGVAVSISQIDFGSRSTGTGPQAYDIRTSLDNFATAAATGTLLVTHADGPYVIQILNSNGSIVKQQSGLPGNPANLVGLYGLRGVYTVKVTTATSMATTKLVVL